MELNRKRLVFLSRLLVIITIGYILVLTPARPTMRLWGYGFIAFYLATNLVIYYLPNQYLKRPWFFYCIVLVDCILITTGIYLTGMEGSDLYLVFFVIVCLATLGSELRNLIIASFLFVLIYGWLLYQQGLFQGEMAISYLLRLPFIMGVALFLGYIVDIQNRAQKERLRETEQKYQSFINKLPVGTFQHRAGKDDRFLLMNRAFGKMLGYENSSLLKIGAKDIFADEKQRRKMYATLREQESVEGFPIDLVCQDGRIFHANIWAQQYPREEDEIIEGVLVDVTELRKAQQALAESEERLRLAGKASYDLVYEWQIRDNIIRWFGDIDAKLGYGAGEISENIDSWLALIHPDDAGKCQYSQNRHPEQGEVYACEYRIRQQDGSWQHWSDHSIPVLDENGIPEKWVGVCTDITRNREMEQQLQQAQKMEAIAVLAGGVAHNFNNTLMSIQGYIATRLLDLSTEDPDYDDLRGIQVAITDAAALTRDLLGFARGGTYEVAPLNLNDLVTSENYIFRNVRKNINIHTRLAEGLWPVEADRNQVQQVLMNLFVNASQAMPEAEGGDVFIYTENVRLSENETAPHHLPAGKYVKIIVQDTGCGIEADLLEKIFDPFFTTKKPGSGTGLGLSSVYGIVKNHAGFIDVTSQVGQGTAFSIYLPASDKTTVAGNRVESPKLRQGDGTILLVDDEEMVINACRRLLSRLNYHVLSAQTGEQALAIYKDRGGEVDLVILDMLMPGMSGDMVFDRLMEMDPAVKVLVSSGYSFNQEIASLLDRGCRGFIQKPFDSQSISEKIQDIIA
ncbi:MAG: response regulator [Desulfosudaceae bacterium]